MRLVLTSAAALIAGALALNAGTTSAIAAPLPSFASLDAASTAVKTVDWRRRYYRRHGVWPPVTGPGAVVEPGVIVETDDDDALPLMLPPRPASCGEFHYWNGEACVDARYNDPYIGPK